MDRHNQPPPRGSKTVTSKDVAIANDYFEHFLNASSLKHILGYYRNICDHLSIRPNLFPLFYPKLRGYLTSWRAKALWKKFDARASHKCYGKGKLCANSRVLIIGGGPCGLRTAIEAQLLGAKVVVIEKRDRFSRNNVLHLWPFVIEDLRILGAKKFFGKFCAGAIDHISIRQLQCILLKAALLLGVEVHTEISFERLLEPNSVDKTGWKAEFKPSNHPVSQYEFDVIIGADGKRNTLEGFKRKEFRGKLAIAITANFINKRTEAEARVQEISGVAFIFNQKFFKELYEATGIDLENIVYYKDDTHYFVMTAKKPSLIEKGVIKQDMADTELLLAPENVNRDALMDYAREAANFSTSYQLPDVEFAVNHYGQPDVAMFDFTSMYAAENASKIIERNGCKLLMILVGDSLLEPFWPTGSGCARGFLSSMDAAWAIRSWCSGTLNPLDVLAERESIYRLLAQTTPDNLNKDWKAYTLDPTTRYPNLNKNVVMPHQTVALFDTDNPKSVERMRRNSHDIGQVEVPKKRRRGNVDNEVLLNWISEQIKEREDFTVGDIASVFREGNVLCAIINHYRPDLLDYNAIKDDEPEKKNQVAIDLLEKEIGISPIMTGEEITHTEDYLTMATYLTQVYDSFRCEIPHIKHPKLSKVERLKTKYARNFKSPEIPPPNPKQLLPKISPKQQIPPEKPKSEESFLVETKVEVSEPVLSSSTISSSDISEMFKKCLVDGTVSVPSTNSNGYDLSTNRFLVEDHHKRKKVINIDYEEGGVFKKIQFRPSSNVLEIVSKFSGGRVLPFCQTASKNVSKFSCFRKKMSESEDSSVTVVPDQIYSRVSSWISNHDFRQQEDIIETNLPDDMTDITSVTKAIEKEKLKKRDVNSDGLVIVEERTDEVKCDDTMDDSLEKKSRNPLVRTLTKFSQYSPFERRRNRTTPPSNFSVIVEGEELELPETKRSDASFKSVKQIQPSYITATQPVPPRPSSRHKRHIDTSAFNKPNSMERKTRKKRTLERMGASVIFKRFLDAFLESTLVGALLVILDILLNSEQFAPPQSSFFSYF